MTPQQGNESDHASGEPRMELAVLEEEFAVCRLPGGSGIPAWASPGKGRARGPLTSISWTAEETSVVCASRMVPADISAQRGWRAIVVEGSVDLAATGVLAALTKPLAQAGVAVFVVSTYETDYLLIKATSLEAAIAALHATGHIVTR